ncbi:hypothetical protein YPPY54_0528, partial [Yersinia pestis PY-54]
NMLGGADNTNGELPSYITGANSIRLNHSVPRSVDSTDKTSRSLMALTGITDSGDVPTSRLLAYCSR